MLVKYHCKEAIIDLSRKRHPKLRYVETTGRCETCIMAAHELMPTFRYPIPILCPVTHKWFCLLFFLSEIKIVIGHSYDGLCDDLCSPLRLLASLRASVPKSGSTSSWTVYTLVTEFRWRRIPRGAQLQALKPAADFVFKVTATSPFVSLHATYVGSQSHWQAIVNLVFRPSHYRLVGKGRT